MELVLPNLSPSVSFLRTVVLADRVLADQFTEDSDADYCEGTLS